MPQRDLIVIGASAGGLRPIGAILAGLPTNLHACVLIVIHTTSDGSPRLAEILARRTALPVAFATDGTPIMPGHVFVAPPDRHLLVTCDGMRVTHGPRENGFRPAIDPLFRSAARTRASRVIGVVLSGALDDGVNGLNLIKRHGGAVIVQDPADAEIPAMPRGALRLTEADAVLPAPAIAPALVALCHGSRMPLQTESPMARTKEPESQLPDGTTEVGEMETLFGPPSGLTCPDCGGALWEIEEGRLVRYKCHVGHQFAPDSLLAGQRDEVEGALWTAVRVLEEHADLRERLARRTATAGLSAVSAAFAEGAEHALREAAEIRTLLFAKGGAPSAALVTERAAIDETPAAKTMNNRTLTRKGARHGTPPATREKAPAKRARARTPPR